MIDEHHRELVEEHHCELVEVLEQIKLDSEGEKRRESFPPWRLSGRLFEHFCEETLKELDGFIGGIISAALYNLVAAVVGGIEIELSEKPPPLEHWYEQA